MSKVIKINNVLTVGELAEELMLPVTKVITELMKNGVMATVNEKIDFDTAQIIVGELDLDVELAKRESSADIPDRVKPELSKQAKPRPPVIAFMGHVDHGKTSLLDAIRGAETTEAEAGGITQHISAYQITHKDRLITLLDTPGHEAFAALRQHGAHLTDVAVIVVAADDGVKPQTVEAIRFAKQAGVKIVVAANKIDKTGGDINRLKQQLAENELAPEGWGGETVVVPVSAKTKEGLDELLDMILLVADIEELKADYEVPARGLIIESHMEQGRGPMGIALVEQGLLRTGDYVVAGATYGKVRSLQTSSGEPMKEAGPSTPACISGLKNLPQFGDEFEVTGDEKIARAKAAEASRSIDRGASVMSGKDLIKVIDRAQELNELNIIVKADVQGSLTSVVDSLKTLDNEKVAVRIVGSGVGVITESDIHMAATSGAIIYGFSVELPTSIKRLANRDDIPVRLFTIIYELIDDVKAELTKLLPPEVIEKELGELVIKGVFKIAKNEVICGGEVIKGKLSLPALARVKRGDKVLAEEVEIINLKQGPQEVKEVDRGTMCGLSFRSSARVPVAEGDHLELFTRETKILTL